MSFHLLSFSHCYYIGFIISFFFIVDTIFFFRRFLMFRDYAISLFSCSSLNNTSIFVVSSSSVISFLSFYRIYHYHYHLSSIILLARHHHCHAFHLISHFRLHCRLRLFIIISSFLLHHFDYQYKYHHFHWILSLYHYHYRLNIYHFTLIISFSLSFLQTFCHTFLLAYFSLRARFSLRLFSSFFFRHFLLSLGFQYYFNNSQYIWH